MLNPNNLLNLLTKYLLQNKRVSLPSVGTIRLVHQPPQLDVANKVILPPSFVPELVRDETVSGHQVAFLSAALQKEKEEVLMLLQQVGEDLKARIKNEGFHWAGIGLIRDTSIESRLVLPALKPVPAERVLRHDATHRVLVGDQEVTAAQTTLLKEEVETVAEKERSVFIIIGWVLLVLSILFIVFILYRGRFRFGSTGSQSAPTGYLPVAKQVAGATGYTCFL